MAVVVRLLLIFSFCRNCYGGGYDVGAYDDDDDDCDDGDGDDYDDDDGDDGSLS